jgi:hypothetical protein
MRGSKPHMIREFQLLTKSVHRVHRGPKAASAASCRGAWTIFAPVWNYRSEGCFYAIAG